VKRLGGAGFLRYCVPQAFGGVSQVIDSRSLCLIRETLAYADGLADFAFAMQGLGTGAISLSGAPGLQQRILPAIAKGELIAAFALTEPEAGSDVAAMSCAARRDGGEFVIDGEKIWISNGGIADVYTLFARTGEAPGTRGISAFVVFADTPGLTIAERLETIAPHPLARLRFENCRIPASQLLGSPGEGFKIAMRTLDIFRPSVAAAALGFARRALDEAVAHAKSRKMFGATLADLPTAQSTLGEMATAIDAAALLTARTAWRRDVQKLPATREAAMAKMTATENAQWVIDQALQLFGGKGVRVGEITESLYREIRALRIYEGATEVQKLIIGRELIKNQAR
jgi:alkylation response protein AidB-like acyl-CoA dehydrogenase